MGEKSYVWVIGLQWRMKSSGGRLGQEGKADGCPE
jgi:hypothetical protein